MSLLNLEEAKNYIDEMKEACCTVKIMPLVLLRFKAMKQLQLCTRHVIFLTLHLVSEGARFT